MKQLLLFTSLLLAGTIAASGQGIAVDADRVHVAYETVDNPITIGLENCSCKNLRLTVDEGQLRKGPDDCTYIFNSDKAGKAIFTLSRKAGDGYADVGQITYRVKPLPLPEAYIGGRHNAQMPIVVFRAQEGVIAKLDGFDFDVWFKVTSFQMDVIRDGQVVSSEKNNKNVFEPGARKAMLAAQPGDKVVFSNILSRKPNGTIVALEPIEITLTK